MENFWVWFRFASKILLTLSFCQFVIVALILRPKRKNKKTPVFGGSRTLVWNQLAHGTVEQKIFQFAVGESILGCAMFIVADLIK
jgi:hypothetical protein